MTQEDKELLLKDLCTRLPYKVHCCIYNLDGSVKIDDDVAYFCTEENIVTLKSKPGECFMLYQAKPYLRPMSSMTSEERSERIGLLWELEGHIDEDVTYRYQDWLNAHHLDYRGLIQKHLALEAPEGMYSHFGDMETIVTVEHKGNKL